MLQSLHISNYALIDNIDIEFGPGLNVITGETGAGKSVIMGALSLILGQRADTSVVGDSTKKSVIEASFSMHNIEDIKEIIGEEEIDWESDNILIRREIIPSGRSRAFINDTPVAIAKLQDIAIHLVDIHSQHQNLLLAQPDFQLDILDSLAGNEELLSSHRARFAQLRNAMHRLKKLKSTIEKSKADEEFLRFQLEQIEKYDLQQGELEQLVRDRDLQANLSSIKESMNNALSALTLGQPNAISLIEQTSSSCDSISHLLPSGENITERLENILIELKDISAVLQNIDSKLEGNPEALDDIDARIADINGLLHRFNAKDTDELLNLRDSLRSKLDILENGDELYAELELTAKKMLVRTRATAEQLSAARKTQAHELEKNLTERAKPLGMKNVQCRIDVSKSDLRANGSDKVEFLFSFNKNQQPLPIGKTASGGEISRIMLSLKAIISERMNLPTLILDEIDTGVSGDVAIKMAELMKGISNATQVIVITHLPQVAAKGSTHFKVYKEDDEVSTHTHIKPLQPNERIDEIATMIGGASITEAARTHARELLSTAGS